MTEIAWLRLAADPGVRVGSLPLACCALEVESAVRQGALRAETAADGHPRETVLLVAGTVTAPLAPLVRMVVDQAPAGTRVVAFGACATSGGPYWDAPSVRPGADAAGAAGVPIDVYVPGCPPPPEALVAAITGREVAP
ncbi:MAG: hypothetical protein GC156_05045 [Actinomycetales bacterium]|nr:hypothetical protein [Actinomycetales bacterium]